MTTIPSQPLPIDAPEPEREPADDLSTMTFRQACSDRFSRDEAVNESEVLKNQASGYSMDTPKGVQADQFAQSQARAPKTRQPNEYGYKKPFQGTPPTNDLTELLTKSVRAADARKAGARR